MQIVKDYLIWKNEISKNGLPDEVNTVYLRRIGLDPWDVFKVGYKDYVRDQAIKELDLKMKKDEQLKGETTNVKRTKNKRNGKNASATK